MVAAQLLWGHGDLGATRWPRSPNRALGPLFSIGRPIVKTIPTIDDACCTPLLAAPLEPEAARTLAAAFKVLADPARLRLLSLVAAHAGGEACVCELNTELCFADAGCADDDGKGAGK